VLVVLALLVINVPFAVHQWQLHRVDSHGLQVSATVVSVEHAGDDALVAFRLPASVDPGQKVRTARVDSAAGAAAARSGEVEVRVLEGHPAVYALDGQIRGRGPLYLTLGADLVILLLVLLRWRLGGRLRRPPLVAIALGDVEDGEDGSLLDKQADGSYLINGEIAEAGDGSVLLVLRDRDVTVHLHGHRNPVSVGERARVRAQLVG
jgi:hypothetical protein